MIRSTENPNPPPVDSSLLLDAGVPFKPGKDGLLVEAQALNGLHLWAKHFSRVTICAPRLPEGYVENSSTVWADPSELLAEGRVAFEPLPWGYHPTQHFRHRTEVRKKFDELVATHRYLCFSNLGVFGGWGTLGVSAARRQRKPYSLWFDWVLHEMNETRDAPLAKRLRAGVHRALTRRVTDMAIRGCSLGLFHGQTVYDAYAPICREPALVHDVHVRAEDAITDSQLDLRLSSHEALPVLRIGYVGRVHPMKAPMQWIEAIAAVTRAVGPERIEATWLGDGPLLDQARTRVKALELDSSIRFPGFVSSRAEVLAFLQRIDFFVFTHVTPESPRVLIEALISGVPLLGYDSSYARELIGERGGALLSPIGNTEALAANIVRVGQDRAALEALTRAAATARPLYTDEAVFAHRSELIKRFL